MGIINVTPDSFSDGGMYLDKGRAVARGEELAAEGADIIDVGGESTRPGAAPVSAEEEIRRVIPVVRELSRRVSIPLSIDTTKAEVARRALECGAEIINDISALRFDPGMAVVASRYNVPVILMHMAGTPRTMQKNTKYACLVEDILQFLRERICVARDSGIEEDKIIIDPGIGFGKNVKRDNFTILHRLEAFRALGRPVLVGPSRKTFIRNLLGTDAGGSDAGTAAAAVIALYNGANIIRVHDVRTIIAAARVADAVRSA